ncbi:hypothetical protein Hanom_Chr08g00740931 [Helianthus anomalus]
MGPRSINRWTITTNTTTSHRWFMLFHPTDPRTIHLLKSRPPRVFNPCIVQLIKPGCIALCCRRVCPVVQCSICRTISC